MKSSHVHVHIDSREDQDLLHQILERLQAQEQIMSALSDAVQGLSDTIDQVVTRIDEDVAHLNDLLSQAQANDAADAEAIETLQADADETVNRLNEATARLSAIDPVANFPVDEGEPPVDPPA